MVSGDVCRLLSGFLVHGPHPSVVLYVPYYSNASGALLSTPTSRIKLNLLWPVQTTISPSHDLYTGKKIIRDRLSYHA
jgi:hypothetical protein